MSIKEIVCLVWLLSLVACNSSTEPKRKNNTRLIAKAGNEELHEDEFNERFISTGVIKDKKFYAKKAIENWAIESLFYQEALSKLHKDEMDIERQVEDYRKSLVNYIYQTKIIEANLDTVIPRSEIQEYYNTHRDNFILKENILKVNYIKVPVLAPAVEKIKRLVHSYAPKDMELLQQLCEQNAENYFMNDSTWLYLEDIKKEIPSLREQPDASLYTGRVVELTDNTYYYYLKVKDIRVKNGLSPLAFEQQNIKKFILNNRKTQLISRYKQIMLDKAKSNKSFQVY